MICTLWSRLFRCSPWTWTSIYTDVIHFAHINLSVAAAWRTLANFPCIFLHYFIFNIYVIYLVKYFWITDFNRGLVDTKVICIACNTFSFGYVVKNTFTFDLSQYYGRVTKGTCGTYRLRSTVKYPLKTSLTLNFHTARDQAQLSCFL